MAPFTLAAGGVLWDVSIDEVDTGYMVHAANEGRQCDLHVDRVTVQKFAESRPGEDPKQILSDRIQLCSGEGTCMILQLRPVTSASRRQIPILMPQPNDLTVDEKGSLTHRPQTIDSALPKLANEGRMSRRSSVPTLSSTPLPQLTPKISPPKSPAKSPPSKTTAKFQILTRSSPGKASGWAKLKKMVRRMPVFELEEAMLRDPHDLKLRIDLGLRYSEDRATEMTAVLLLEQASFFSDHSSAGWRFWGTLGDIHYALLARYSRHDYRFGFHLNKCTAAFNKALTFIENASDPGLIAKYATSLFMKGERELPYELLKTLSLTYGTNGSRLDPHAVAHRLFLLFQITLANNIVHEAIAHMTKLIRLAAETPALVPMGYTLNDCELMLARCCQIEGDFLFATNTFARILGDKYGPSSVYSDEQYLAVWHSLATACYTHGHMWLSIEYHTVALTYAKHLALRATVFFRRGLSFFCIGEPIKAEDDYRRARSTYHDAKPEISLHELKKEYQEEFDKLLDTPVADLISQVRRGMGKTTASIKVQRHFRHFMLSKRKKSDASRIVRRFSVGARPQAIHALPPELTKELSDVTLAARSMPEPQPIDPTIAWRESALQSLHALHTSCLELTPSGSKKTAQPHRHAVSFLSPDYDRPDYRRHRSITSYRRLGYSTGDVSCVQHWKAVVQCGRALYPTPGALRRGIAQVKFFHTGVPDAVAICALADSDGQVDEACGKLSDASYRAEIDCICCVFDVLEWMTRPADGDQDLLPGAPEIDPETGKFYVHRIPPSMLGPKSSPKADKALTPSPERDAPVVAQDVFARLKHRQRVKDTSFRIGQVIATHSTADVAAAVAGISSDHRLPPPLQAIPETPK
ncbi:Aste57867_21127 [Aphanomyces stellatus]|uniref:Aste57867_21127 protein n=1 Tax=Aphanomyces stellatus TaxID=120398 RepID=A0A485LI55_9STRA|nr:hypothetical protein As57867_021059 [Aphanomyces stellatus]VFT97801.1 Aste57867_21127 [Aphanomyces stellatus]